MGIPTWTYLCHKDCPKDNVEVTAEFLLEAAGYFLVFILILAVVWMVIEKYFKRNRFERDED